MKILDTIDKAVTTYGKIRDKTNNVLSSAINVFGDLVNEFSFEIKFIIEEKLKKSVIKNVLSLLLYIGALLISYFAFPNKTAATYITSIILLVVLAITLIRVIKLIIKYHYYLFCFIRSRFKVFDSIVYYVKHKKGKVANIAISILDILLTVDFIKSETVKKMQKQVIRSALGIVKIMIVDLVFFAVYMIVVSKVVKPILLNNMVGLTTLQLYIYPFVRSFDFIFHTSLCGFFGINV